MLGLSVKISSLQIKEIVLLALFLYVLELE